MTYKSSYQLAYLFSLTRTILLCSWHNLTAKDSLCWQKKNKKNTLIRLQESADFQHLLAPNALKRFSENMAHIFRVFGTHVSICWNEMPDLFVVSTVLALNRITKATIFMTLWYPDLIQLISMISHLSYVFRYCGSLICLL